MSAPTGQFHRLSIGQDMSDSRAQLTTRAARSAGRPGVSNDESDHDEDDRSSSETESESGEYEESSNEESRGVSKIRAQSGITYDLRHLDTESEARALVGLTEQYDVVNCRGSGSGYEFQLLDRPRVHLGRGSPTCTCSTFQGRPELACHHIFVSLPSTLPLPFLLFSSSFRLLFSCGFQEITFKIPS